MAILTAAKPLSTMLTRMLIGALIPVSTFLGTELMIEGVARKIMGGMIIYMLGFLTLGMVMIVSGPVILGLVNALLVNKTTNKSSSKQPPASIEVVMITCINRETRSETMDIASIATATITILSPYLAKIGEEVSKKAADAA